MSELPADSFEPRRSADVLFQANPLATDQVHEKADRRHDDQSVNRHRRYMEDGKSGEPRQSQDDREQ